MILVAHTTKEMLPRIAQERGRGCKASFTLKIKRVPASLNCLHPRVYRGGGKLMAASKDIKNIGSQLELNSNSQGTETISLLLGTRRNINLEYLMIHHMKSRKNYLKLLQK